MTRSWWSKFAFLVFTVVLSAVYVYPTLARLDLNTTKFPFKQKVNLGLDLQGGLYMVLGVDFNKVYSDVIDRQVGVVRDSLKEAALPITDVTRVHTGTPADDPRIQVNYDASKRDAVIARIKEYVRSVRLTGDEPGKLELGIASDYRREIREQTIDRSILVIRNRIDEFGVSEPAIASQGTDRIVVELPGVRDIDRAKDLIGRTARLEFRIVDDQDMQAGQVAGLVQEAEKTVGPFQERGQQKFSEYVQKINDQLKGKIPANSEIAYERSRVAGQTGEVRMPYLLYKKVNVSGDDLQDAQVTFDQETRAPEVAFTMNARGATLMGDTTEANKGHRLAIVLDNIVHSAPVIQSKIMDRGRITLGRGGNHDQMMREAKDLAIVLRAGALPAQLEFLEQRVVGPSLGQDSIHKGAMAALVGALLVFVFVSIYYRVSGLIAVFSLVLNVLFVLACLVGLEATLTLPGIAGIALTIGIAVDSNVVIYERIREELEHGKRPGPAVEAGFQKAFRTILDANVTNAVAAVVLLIYGTGPIKGFAVTMLIGIVTTLFTAVFVCRLVFDLYVRSLEDKGSEALSI